MINKIETELILLSNRVKYINEILNETIDLRRKKKDEITIMLTEKGYDMIDNDYKYLTKMSMDSVTEEYIHKMNTEYLQKQKELCELSELHISMMWLNELGTLKMYYNEYKDHRYLLNNDSSKTTTKATKIIKKIIKKIKK